MNFVTRFKVPALPFPSTGTFFRSIKAAAMAIKNRAERKFLKGEVETVFRENEAKRSIIFKSKFGHRKLLRKWF